MNRNGYSIIVAGLAGAAVFFTLGLFAAAPAAGATSADQALPAELQPVFYRALARDAGATYRINKNGCASLAKQDLTACFSGRGAHFSGAGSLALHLAAWGRAGRLVAVPAVTPVIEDNAVRYSHGTLTEWWWVLPVGFEQGFTIAKRPAGQGDLTLVLTASRQDAGAPTTRHSRESGNLGVRPSASLRAVYPEHSRRAQGERSGEGTLAWGELRYGKLVVTDATGKVIPATMRIASKLAPTRQGHEARGDRILIAVNDTRAVYPLTVDPLVWIEQKVTASGGTGGFGLELELAGDTAVIGARFTDVGGHTDQGAVYVFTRSNGTWSQAQTLTASGGAANDNFGFSVALDGNTLAIGAPFVTVGGNAFQGAAYVFTRSGGVWGATQTLTANGGAANELFGYSVALAGNTIVIGAEAADVGSHVDQGAAYVFTRSGGVWSEVQTLTTSGGAAHDNFGWWAELAGNTAVIGAPFADVGGNADQGAAYVFTRSNGAWSEAQTLTTSNGTASDWFGESMALAGDTLVIGAPQADVGGNAEQGAAYVFTRSGGVWSEAQTLTASGGATDDSFGWEVALAGDTAVIGAPGAVVGGNAFQGTAYLFTRSGGVWSATQTLTASDGAANDEFGEAVALDGDTIVIGAPDAVIGSQRPGAAYFYGASNLGLAVSAPQTVNQGQNYVSQTIVTNSSSVPSLAVAVAMPVPAAASFVAATATQGSCNMAAGVVTCDFGAINGNAGTAKANVTLKATGSVGTTIGNTASVVGAQPALTASAATTIATANLPPVARYGLIQLPFLNLVIAFDTSYDPDGSIVDRLWHFDDGSPDAGGRVVVRITNAGTLTLTVTDNLGATASIQKNL